MPDTFDVRGTTLDVTTAGTSGPPVLLLHGFPQTSAAWRKVVPLLSDTAQVVCPDLPGYGASGAPSGEDDPLAYSKRETARTMVALMRALGHDRFAVVGHDRGGLVAFRAALDHPDVVTHAGILDIIPTVDNWAALGGASGIFAFHLFLLGQPMDIAERMVGADPDLFYGHFLDTWTVVEGAVEPDVRLAYLAACGRPKTTHAICQDYRASAMVDEQHDQADRDAGNRLTMPTLAMWQDPGDVQLPFDPAEVWASWAPDLDTDVVPCGHFLPEEAPERVAAAIRRLLDRG